MVSVERADIGLVSADRSLADFFARVFELEELDPIPGPDRTVYRLQLPNTILRVMVPTRPPSPPEVADPFYAVGGMRYVTVWVDDVDSVVDRAVANGAVVTMQPVQARPTVRAAVFLDPDGNSIEVATRLK
jgi:catechol 2,3-dioxygenase-like lactoylglutathione lyase family enzyme